MNSSIRKDIFFLSALLLLSVALFGIKLGACGLLDPDEPFYALTAKEMLRHHEWSTPLLFGHPQFEKPILFYWLIAVCFKLFGISEFSARLGPCLAGTLTVLVTYGWARILSGKSMVAFISAVVLATGIEFIVLSRIVLTDMLLCFFVTAAFFCFSVGYLYPKKRRPAWLAFFLFCALGFLTKGPLGILLPFFGIVPYLVLTDETKLLKEIPWLAGAAIFFLIGGSWYALMTAKYGLGFLSHFFLHENARRFFFSEHKSFNRFYFYPAALFIGTFPWGVFLVPALWHGVCEAVKRRTVGQKNSLFLIVSLSTAFCFFMAAKSKLLSYVFPVFPIAAVLIGMWIYRAVRSVRLNARPTTGFVLFAFIYLAVLPAGVVIGTAVYDHINQLNLAGPILAIGFSWAPCCWIGFFCIFRKKYKQGFIFITAGMTFFSFFVFGWLLPQAEGAFSSRREADVYQRLAVSEKPGLLLASKLTVRGVSYYTDRERVGIVADDPNGLFYTPHPVPIFSNSADFLDMDPGEFPVYCFLRDKEWQFLKPIITGHFAFDVLDVKAQRILVKLDRLA